MRFSSDLFLWSEAICEVYEEDIGDTAQRTFPNDTMFPNLEKISVETHPWIWLPVSSEAPTLSSGAALHGFRADFC